MDYIIHNGELYHWGIKGMKWGQRRYQNKDGSLTPAGVKRYNKEVQKLKDREASIKAREKARTYQTKLDKKKVELDEREAALKGKNAQTKKAASDNKTVAVKAKSGAKTQQKSIKDMSDEELVRAINRLTLENQYRALAPEQISTGKKFAKDFGDKALSLILDGGEKLIRSAIDDAISNKGKVPKEPTEMEKLKAKYDKMKLEKDISDLTKPARNDLADALEYYRNASKNEVDDIKNAAQFYENIDKIRKKK